MYIHPPQGQTHQQWLDNVVETGYGPEALDNMPADVTPVVYIKKTSHEAIGVALKRSELDYYRGLRGNEDVEDVKLFFVKDDVIDQVTRGKISREYAKISQYAAENYAIPEEVIGQIRNDIVFSQIVENDPPVSGVNKAKRSGMEVNFTCRFHNDKNPSMGVNDAKQTFSCVSCGAGGNVFKYVQMRDGVDFAEAVRTLDTNNHLHQYFYDRSNLKTTLWRNNYSATPKKSKEERRKIYNERKESFKDDTYKALKSSPMTPPEDITPGKRIRVYNAKNNKMVTYTPKMVFPYKGADGATLFNVIRMEFKDKNPEDPSKEEIKKVTPQIIWAQYEHEGELHEGWVNAPYNFKGILKPLGALDMIAKSPQNSVILIHEGEKAALGGVKYFPNNAHSFWAGGVKGVFRVDDYFKTIDLKVDLEPLRGRTIIYCPDNDQEGYKIAYGLGVLLENYYDCKFKITLPVPGAEKKWDAYDALPNGLSTEDFKRHVKHAVNLDKYAEMLEYFPFVKDVDDILQQKEEICVAMNNTLKNDQVHNEYLPINNDQDHNSNSMHSSKCA